MKNSDAIAVIVLGGVIGMLCVGVVVGMVLAVSVIGGIQERDIEMETCGAICTNEANACYAYCNTKSDYKWWGGVSNERSSCRVYCSSMWKKCLLDCGYVAEKVK